MNTYSNAFMMMLTLISFLFMTTSILMFLTQPLTIGLMLLAMATLTTCLIGYSFSSLLALMLFLIYIGGIMMMFAYFIAASPNTNLTTETQPLKFLFPLSLLIIHSLSTSPNNYSFQLMSSTDQKLLVPLESAQIISIIFLMFLLLFTMMVIVKIATMNAAPMRPFK